MRAKENVTRCGLSEAEFMVRERLLELQQNPVREFSQEEFDRLRELANKMFANSSSVNKKVNVVKKFILRHWRGNGQIIPDIMKDSYDDYPKHRNMRPYKLSECIHKVISQKEYLQEVLKMYGVEAHNKAVLKHKLGNWNLIGWRE